MKHSVIINVLNGEKYIAEAIESVLNQSNKNWELIVFDNASTDNTAQVVASYTDPRIRVIIHTKTVALGEARNLALPYATGEFISFLDADDIYRPCRLTKISQYFINQRDVDIVYSNSSIIDKNSIHKRFLYKKSMPGGLLTRELIRGYFLSLETVCFRKSILGETKFNSEFSFIEEADFFIRLTQNRKFGYIDDVLASWREHSESWTFKESEKFLYEAIQFKKKLKEVNLKFYETYQKEIELFIRNQDVFHNKMQYFLKDGRKYHWIASLIRRRKVKDYLQIVGISALPRSILRVIYT